MRSPKIRHAGAAFALLLAGAVPALADHTARTLTGTEEIKFSARPEAWAMKYFAGVSLFSGFGPPQSTEPFALNFAMEVTAIPKLDRDERRVGFDGTKEEDTNKAPLLIRPRITAGLTEKLSLTASYVPPVKVFDVKTELVAASLNRALVESGNFTLGARGFAQYGKVEGDITCPKRKLHKDSYAPHCEEPSNDTMRMRAYGIELSASYRIPQLRSLAPYLSVSRQKMKLDFEVDAVMPHDFHDQRRLTASGTTTAFGAGATLPLTERLRLSAGVVYMPNHVRRREPDPPFEQRSRRNEPMMNARFQIDYAL